MTLLDLLSRDVTLTKRGKEWVGLCPFHGEKTPSFYVNEDKQLYFCFACGAKGDAITFIMKQRGLTFHQAQRALGRDLPLAPVRKSPAQRALAAARGAYQQWETTTLDRITHDYWRACDDKETVELHMVLLLAQREPGSVQEWDRWQRLFDRLQQEEWATLEQLAFFQNPATTGERVQLWEREGVSC